MQHTLLLLIVLDGNTPGMVILTIVKAHLGGHKLLN